MAAAVVGAFVPLLPTTPFLLLAAWAFARGSDRVHDWLVSHPRFGPPLRDWRAHRAVSRRAKAAAVAAMVAAFVVALVAGVPGWVLTLQVAVLIAVATFLLTRPEPPSADPTA